MLESLAVKAFGLGILSAVSLPMGALVALVWVPKQKIVAVLMAFGGGALLAALTIDLVGEALEKGDFYPLALGCIVGGMLFVILNQVINKRGGFLRKVATTVTHLKREKMKYFISLFKKMSMVPLFHQLPPEEIHTLIHYVSKRKYKKGRTIIRQGDPGDSLFIIESGEVNIIDEKNNLKKVGALKKNDVLGEIALLTGEPRSFSAIAATDTKVFLILKEHFDKLLKTSPILSEALKKLVSSRISDLQEKKFINPKQAEEWASEALRHFDTQIVVPTEIDIKEAATTHGGAPLAIWLGILLDGIPESLVIGSSILRSSISFSLLAGLFLSNFPEALSSSACMRQQNYSPGKIFWMWTSLMIITGIGAFFGNILFVKAPPFLFALVGGIAAGAMLTMIAETMLPEAFYKGGAVTGFSTLLGFLAAIFFKTLE